MPCLLNTCRARKIGDHMSISLVEDERSSYGEAHGMRSYLRRRSGLGSFTGSQDSHNSVP